MPSNDVLLNKRAVHEYARLDLGIMVSVIENDSGDLLNFAALALDL